MIEFRNVSFAYERVEALHDLTFSIGCGEIVGLLGPNGAGKSTTLKIVAGLLAPGDGTVSVDGLTLPEHALEVKQRIGYVPESAVLFESLTGPEFLELCGRLHDVEERVLQDRIRDLLDVFELSGEGSSRLDTYSKGMRQKILIGSALLHNPDLILLDEPLSGLDVNSAILIKDLIAALAAEGKTVVYSSHVLDVVEKVCNRALIIHQGRLIAEGTTAELKASTGRSTLEEVFRALTGSDGANPGVSRIVAGLRA